MEPGSRTTYTQAHQLAAIDIKMGDMVHTESGWVVADIVAVRNDLVIIQHGEKTATFLTDDQVAVRMGEDG